MTPFVGKTKTPQILVAHVGIEPGTTARYEHMRYPSSVVDLLPWMTLYMGSNAVCIVFARPYGWECLIKRIPLGPVGAYRRPHPLVESRITAGRT